MATDSQLTAAFVNENAQEALAELVHRYVNLVYSAALRQVGKDAHAADDVVQLVFAHFVRQASSLRNRASLGGWFYTTTHHLSANFVRGEQRRKRREMEALVMEGIDSDGATDVDWSRLAPVLDAAMHELNEQDREAILMRYFDMLPLARVGERLGITENAAAKRVERAIDRLRARFAKRGIDSATAALAIALSEQAVIAAPASLAPAVTSSLWAGAAATSASALLTSLNIMIASKTLVGIVSVVTAVAIGIAVYQTKERRAASDGLAALRSERDALVQQTHPLRAEIARSNATSASVPVPPTSAVSSPVSPANLRQYVGAHPDLRPLFLEQVALKVRTQYSPFFRAAHVSAEQQEAFVKLSIKPMIMNLDLDNALRAFGENRPSADTPAGAQLMDTVKKNAAELKTDATEGMRQIFGDEIYAAYQKYHDTISERGIAESLAGQLYYSLTPITAEQGDKLVTILAQSRFDPKSAQSSENSIAGSTILPSEVARYTSDKNPPLGSLITDGALTRAQAILTPDQIIALKRLQMQQLLEIQLQPENAKERSP